MLQKFNNDPYHISALVANAACTGIPEACKELIQKVALFSFNSLKRAYIF